MKYIRISLDDPKYRHEATLVKQRFKNRLIDTILVPADTKFGRTKLLTQISASDAQNLARIIGAPSFCYLPVYNRSNTFISLYNRPNIFDPKSKFPSIRIWDSGLVYFSSWNDVYPDPVLIGLTKRKIREYLVDNGYLLIQLGGVYLTLREHFHILLYGILVLYHVFILAADLNHPPLVRTVYATYENISSVRGILSYHLPYDNVTFLITNHENYFYMPG